MNELTVFKFEEKTEVRTLERDGETWWVAKDVCDILGIENARDAIANFPENERSTVAISDGTSPLGGNPNVNIVNEQGLYRLVFKSRKPEAERFKTWVFTEVLPSIRKKGYYELQKLKLERDALNAKVIALRNLPTLTEP
jgi:anti-repressor protein